jgi:hypothetical protein
VLQSGPNPSTDYYIRPRAVAGGVPTVYRDVEQDRPSAEDLQDGTLVIVVRYLSRPWAEALHASAARLAGVVYFMDDDLLDPSAWAGLPSPYHQKLTRHFVQGVPALASLISQLWVSTPVLQERYADLRAQVVPPLPLPGDEGLQPAQPQPDEPVLVFYHGTSAHMEEMRWLQPVMAIVLTACPQVLFEIIGNQEVNKLYRHLPRTRVLHPMSWPNYLSHCRNMRGHIGLAPLLHSSFNAGRSATKVMDIARCRAIGVYGRVPPYDTAITDGADAILISMDQQAWAEAIINVATRLRHCSTTQHHAKADTT